MLVIVVLNLFYVVATLCIRWFWTYGGSYATIAGREMSFFSALILVAWMVSSAQNSLARATLNAQTVARSEAVAHRLLSAMCDAVVYLDHDLVIQQPSPKLEALLLRPQSASSLQGLSFQDFLLDDHEKANFNHRLSQSVQLHAPWNRQNNVVASVADGLACSMPSKMRDLSGSAVPVQLFYSSFQVLSTNQFCHIIGVKEDALEERLAPMQSTNARRRTVRASGGSGGATVEARIRAAVVADVDDSSPMPESKDAQLEVESYCSSVRSSETASVATLVSVDTFTANLRVTGCSTSFTVLGGPSGRCMDCATWVHKKQLDPFKIWLQATFNQLMWQDEPPQPFDGLVLRPPHLVKHRVWIKVTIRLWVSLMMTPILKKRQN